MASSLREYQSATVAQLSEALVDLSSRDDPDRFIMFKAPTGAGKTVMLAAAIAEAVTHAPHGLAFLWLTPGAGDLEHQSAARLAAELASTPATVALLDRVFANSHSDIPSGQVVVSNWESLVTRDKKTGNYTNHLTRDGERSNLWDLLQCTADSGTRLVVVIDESHHGAEAAGTTALLDAVDAVIPSVRLEASATPTRETTPAGRANGNHVEVYVPVSRVIDEGMITKSVRLNHGVKARLDGLSDDDQLGPTGEQTVLDGAWGCLQDLEAAYVSEHSPVRPLLLVQLPDSDAGAAKQRVVEAFFAAHGITRGNGLAVWFDGERDDEVDDIAAFDSSVRVLLFKQAIAKGWDCPRAQVLVMFRETKSATFHVQTLGRIMRMPERRHYDTDLLNDAYLYANVAAPVIEGDHSTGSPPRDVPTHRRFELYAQAPFTLTSVHRSRAGTYGDIISGKLYPHLQAAAGQVGLGAVFPATAPKTLTAALVTDAVADGATLADEGVADVGVVDTVAARQSDTEAQESFDQLLRSHTGGYRGVRRSADALRSALRSWVVKHAGWDTDFDVVDLQRTCLSPAVRPVLEEALELAVASYTAADAARINAACVAAEVTDPAWEISERIDEPSQSTEELTHHAYLFTPCRLDKNRPHTEKAFEAWLESEVAEGRVLWWWKNGESLVNYLGIPYDNHRGNPATFYPDYIVCLTDGTVCVYEVKGGSDQDPDTPLKAAEGRVWVGKMAARPGTPDVRFGICVSLGKTWAVNDGTSYTHPHPAALTTPGTGWKALVLGD
jgi:type III restriction enzyme